MATPDSPLDLYAKVEDLLGVKEAAPDLYAHYLLALQGIAFDSLLDVGCGSGDFIVGIQQAFPGATFRGIDLSGEMITRAREQGVEAEQVDLCDDPGQYDVITAVFDMLNYLDGDALQRFGRCVREHLNDGGVFLCDTNTLYGFENVAVGSFIAEDAERFVTIDSDFEAGEYRSVFNLFEREDVMWHRSIGEIRQFYHSPETLQAALGMELVEQVPVYLYDEDEADKVFWVFRKNKIELTTKNT